MSRACRRCAARWSDPPGQSARSQHAPFVRVAKRLLDRLAFRRGAVIKQARGFRHTGENGRHIWPGQHGEPGLQPQLQKSRGFTHLQHGRGRITQSHDHSRMQVGTDVHISNQFVHRAQDGRSDLRLATWRHRSQCRVEGRAALVAHAANKARTEPSIKFQQTSRSGVGIRNHLYISRRSENCRTRLRQAR